MEIALLNDDIPLSATWFNDETEVDPGTVTVSVYREDGTELVSDAATTPDDNSRTYTIDSQYTTQQDILKVVWSADDSYTKATFIELFERHFVELAEIRGESEIDNTTNFPTSRIIRARQWFTDLSQNYCNVPFIPRYGRTLISGNYSRKLRLPIFELREILSARLDDTAITTTDWVPQSSGNLITTTGYFTGGVDNYNIAYTYGYSYPDEELKLAALDAIRGWLIEDRAGTTARTLSMTNQYMGTTKYSVAGKDKPTGIPHVDAVLNERKRKVMVL